MAIPCQTRVCLTLLMLVLPCFLLRRAHAATQSQPMGEAELLLQMKRAWGDPPVLAAWNVATSGAHCRWPYVGCDSAGHVTSLVLNHANVTGPISDAVGGLSSLVRFDVSNNSITGVFPTALYRCRSLRYLQLSVNSFKGELPNDIGHGLGANLSILDLQDNYFNGSIPASLLLLQNLRYLMLGFNSFTGAIPVEFGELRSLKELLLSNNPFDEGELPASFENLTNLVRLWAWSCSLVSDFPNYVVKMVKLEMLDLSYNSLTGSIPMGIWSLRNLQLFYVSVNNLSGAIPEGLCAGGHLRSLDASTNHLNGSIPRDLANCATLQILVLDNNQLSGEVSRAMWTKGQLQWVSLRNDQLSGSLPTRMSSNLRTLDIGNNQNSSGSN